MQLVLAGGSSHTDKYATDLRRHASDRIQIIDWVSGNALEELLSNAALFVLPSDMEGMSLSLLDAMSAGVCVLASDLPENLEVICDAGFSFKAGDVGDLRRMLAFLLADTKLREETGRRAQERVLQNYLWENVAAEMSLLYESLVGASPKKLNIEIDTLAKAA